MQRIDWTDVLKHIQTFTTSGSAKIRINNLTPLKNKDLALSSIQEIFDATEVLQKGSRPHLESLDFFEPWFARIKKKAVLKTSELKDIRFFCYESIALRETLEPIYNSWARQIYKEVFDASEPLSAIDQILTPRGEIRSDASQKLFHLFREKENLSRQLHSSLDRLVHDHKMETILQDKYVTTREGRWVLPVRSGMQHSLDGVIHSSSQTKQTVFMEPSSVIPLNNRLRQVDVEIEDEIERLLTELSYYLHGLTEDFSLSRELLEEVDATLAKAQWSLLIEANSVEFSEESITLNDVKHPLLVLSGKLVVPNAVHLDHKKSILLLSGPNAGGKTVLLKSIGLAAQMARCGLPICAGLNSILPFFDQILVGIGDSQNVNENLSTFAAHLKILDEASNLIGFQNLILVDEICGATDPEEGSALGRSFIEKFSSNQVFGIITSHLGPLKSGWTTSDRVLNGSMKYDSKHGCPTYQFLQGIPGDSLAIQTAKQIGISKNVIDRAIDLLSPATRERLAKLDEIDRLKADINTLREHLKNETSRAQFEKEKYQKLSGHLEKNKGEILNRLQKETSKKLDELIQQSKVDQTFKKHSSLQDIKNQLPEIIKSRNGSNLSSVIDSAEVFSKKFPPGSKVFVSSIGQDAVIQSHPNQKGEVLVLSGSIRLSLPWQTLKPPIKSQNPTLEILRRTPNINASLHDLEKTLDLRGLTTEEALSQLEVNLDRASTLHENRIKIIHGHGTETLKKAVRTYLSRSIYVKTWKAGSPEQGGDGVTWAELDN